MDNLALNPSEDWAPSTKLPPYRPRRGGDWRKKGSARPTPRVNDDYAAYLTGSPNCVYSFGMTYPPSPPPPSSLPPPCEADDAEAYADSGSATIFRACHPEQDARDEEATEEERGDEVPSLERANPVYDIESEEEGNEGEWEYEGRWGGSTASSDSKRLWPSFFLPESLWGHRPETPVAK